VLCSLFIALSSVVTLFFRRMATRETLARGRMKAGALVGG
jgi:hypothetical protein